MSEYPKVAQLKTVGDFRVRLLELGLDLPVDDAILTAEQGSPMAQPLQIGPGRFRFTDFQATKNPQRFYRVSSP